MSKESPDNFNHNVDSEDNKIDSNNKYEIKQSTSKTNKVSQKKASTKLSKTTDKASTAKTVSYKTSKKETTNIDMNNAPNKAQIKKYENIGKEGMNYRADIFKTNESVQRLEKDIEAKHKKLLKVYKEKQNLKIYLGKLEKIVQNKTDTDNTTLSIAPKTKKTTKSIKEDNLMTISSNNNKTEENQNMTQQSEEKINDDVKLTISMTGTSPVITMDDGQGNKNIIKSKKGLMKFFQHLLVQMVLLLLFYLLRLLVLLVLVLVLFYDFSLIFLFFLIELVLLEKDFLVGFFLDVVLKVILPALLLKLF